MQKFLTWLSGKKTYIVAGLTVLVAAYEFWTGKMTEPQAIEMALGGAGLGALRHGVSGTIAGVIEKMELPKLFDMIKTLPAPPPILAGAAPELLEVQKVVAAAVAAGHDPVTVATVASTALAPKPATAG